MMMAKLSMKEILSIIIIMVQALIIIEMVMYTMVNGKMAKDMAKVYFIIMKIS
jgi:hypothetical protein